jgi:PAS domain S-box-containing protein
MLVSAPMVRILMEALVSRGLDGVELLREAEISPSAVASRSARISWPCFVRLCNAVSRRVHDDPEALRALGAAMSPAEPLPLIARYLTSPATFYDIVIRWVAPANFPHLRLYSNRSGANRFSIHGVIPPAFEPCEAFLQISIGAMVGVPKLLGMEPAMLLDVQVTDRTVDMEMRLPSERRSVGRSVRTLLGRFRQNEVLEAQRLELADGLAASRRSQAELRALLERLPDMVVVHVEGRVRFANRAFIRAMGWTSPEDVVGRTLFEVVDPRSRRLLEERLAQAPDAPTMPELTDVWLLRPDGEPVHVEIVPTQAVVFDGEAARLIVGRDIGDRERLQQRLAAADRLASLGLLAAGVAHEVNNPLAYLLNNIEIAKRHLGRLGDDGKPAADALQVALEGVDRIRFIVRELLQLARVEPAEGTSTDLGALAQSTLSLARAEIESTARVTVDIAESPAIRGSVPRIAQIILNLVINATDAMREMPREHNELVVRVRPEGSEHVMLEVSDTGAGVAAPHVDRLFDPFFTTKPGGAGTGLGLTITQRLVADLHGEISFTSAPGRGTTFRVLFPVSHQG